MDFCFLWNNFNIYMVLIQKKIIWKHLNCGLFLGNGYIRLNKNGHEISLEMVYERKETFQPKMKATITSLLYIIY